MFFKIYIGDSDSESSDTSSVSMETDESSEIDESIDNNDTTKTALSIKRNFLSK